MAVNVLFLIFVNVLSLISPFLTSMSDHCLPLSRYQAVVTAPLTVEGTVSVQIALVALARSREALTPGTPKDWLDTPRPKGAGILSSLGAHWHCPR